MSLRQTPDAQASRPAPGREAGLVVFAMCLPSGVTWLYFMALDGVPAPWPHTAYALGKTLQFALPLAWWGLRRLPLRPLPRPGLGDLLLGLAWGLIVAAGMAGLYGLWLRPSGLLAGAGAAIAHKTRSLGLATPAAFAATAVFYAVIHSLLEEYYWRWFVFGRLRDTLPWGAAATLSSVAFGAHHFLLLGVFFGAASPGTWLCGLAVIVGGAVWAAMYQWRGNLYACWLSHALVDAALFAVGYDLLRALPPGN